jgi:3-phosphoshikimate 1-carboxyvinyltransferase
MAVGETRITGLLEGQDVLDTAKAMRAFGAVVDAAGRGRMDGERRRRRRLCREPADVIDCGNSGTGVRLIMGAMATTPITATFTGDASLSRARWAGHRPAVAVRRAGLARRAAAADDHQVGAANPVPVRYARPVASAQVKSAVLLAGLNAPGETVVIEKEPTRDHSERMLARLRGHHHGGEDGRGPHVITLTGRPELRPQTVAVPRDPSSAAFPVARR